VKWILIHPKLLELPTMTVSSRKSLSLHNYSTSSLCWEVKGDAMHGCRYR